MGQNTYALKNCDSVDQELATHGPQIPDRKPESLENKKYSSELLQGMTVLLI
jgi:hypothetical protein